MSFIAIIFLNALIDDSTILSVAIIFIIRSRRFSNCFSFFHELDSDDSTLQFDPLLSWKSPQKNNDIFFRKESFFKFNIFLQFVPFKSSIALLAETWSLKTTYPFSSDFPFLSVSTFDCSTLPYFTKSCWILKIIKSCLISFFSLTKQSYFFDFLHRTLHY